MVHGLDQTAQASKGNGQVMVGIGIARIEIDSTLEVLDRFLDTARGVQGHAQAVVSQRVVRP